MVSFQCVCVWRVSLGWPLHVWRVCVACVCGACGVSGCRGQLRRDLEQRRAAPPLVLLRGWPRRALGPALRAGLETTLADSATGRAHGDSATGRTHADGATARAADDSATSRATKMRIREMVLRRRLEIAYGRAEPNLQVPSRVRKKKATEIAVMTREDAPWCSA
jgi:hypothetical protein